MAVNLEHKVLAGFDTHAAVLHFGENLFVVRRVYHDYHVLIVLRRRAQHRRSADVDILHRFGKVRAAHNRLLERIKIDDNHVYRVHAQFFQLRHMIQVASHGEQPCVNVRVERLYSAVKTLGKTCDFADIYSLYARVFQRGFRAAGGYDLVAEVL